MVVLMNTLNYDRFDLIKCLDSTNDETFQGYVMSPQMGRTCFDKAFLLKSSSSDKITLRSSIYSTEVENRFYICEVDNTTGQIISLKDKRTKKYHRQVVKESDCLNKLIIHDDVPFFWDNWDIMHHAYETKIKKVQEKEKLVSFKIVDATDTQVNLLFEFKISDESKLKQEISFYSDTAKIDFKTDVDWYEKRKLLKVYFPVNVRTDYATFEIGSGIIRRPIHANTSWD